MSLQVERDAKRARELLDKPDVMDAMAIRCEEQGHDLENCMTGWLTFYQACKWCGHRENFRGTGVLS